MIKSLALIIVVCDSGNGLIFLIKRVNEVYTVLLTFAEFIYIL